MGHCPPHCRTPPHCRPQPALPGHPQFCHGIIPGSDLVLPISGLGRMKARAAPVGRWQPPHPACPAPTPLTPTARRLPLPVCAAAALCLYRQAFNPSPPLRHAHYPIYTHALCTPPFNPTPLYRTAIAHCPYTPHACHHFLPHLVLILQTHQLVLIHLNQWCVCLPPIHTWTMVTFSLLGMLCVSLQPLPHAP